MDNARESNRCQGKTKQGKHCRAAATEGGLCFFHANPNKAAELGRIGGRKNRNPSPGIPYLPQDLETAKGVRDECARLIENVYAGKVSPKVVACLVPLLSLQMRVIHSADLEERIAKLEQAQDGSSGLGENAAETSPIAQQSEDVTNE